MTYANVVSTLCLVLVVGGGSAYAGALIGSNDIKDDAVRSRHIINGGVKSGDVADEALTGADIANASLDGGEIAQATLGPFNIIGDSLTHQVIANNAVRANELAPDAIPGDGTGNDGSTKLGVDSVNFDEIAPSAVRSVQVKDDSLGGPDINESTLGPSIAARSFDGPSGNANEQDINTADQVSLGSIVLPPGKYFALAEFYIWAPESDAITCRLKIGGTTIEYGQGVLLEDNTETFVFSGVFDNPGFQTLDVTCQDNNGEPPDVAYDPADGYHVGSTDITAIPIGSF